MNAELINLIEDLKELGENRVEININSLLNTIKLCGYSCINSDDTQIGIFENDGPYLTSNKLVGVLHYMRCDLISNDILITGFTHCPRYNFILY